MATLGDFNETDGDNEKSVSRDAAFGLRGYQKLIQQIKKHKTQPKK